MTTMQTPVDNGVNVEALLGARDSLADNPEMAQFQWRAEVSWVSGTHSRSTVDTFYGFGEQQKRKRKHGRRAGSRSCECRWLFR